MTVHIAERQPDRIVLRVRAEGDGLIGDMTKIVRPGEKVFGLTFEQWQEAESPVEIPESD